MPGPTLQTARLHLRPLTQKDAPAVTTLAGDAAVAATTLRIAHPYPPSAAEAFIESQRQLAEAGLGATFGITLCETGDLIGCIGLGADDEHLHAELGYWIGVDHWGRGYATEAARMVVGWGFANLRLHRITARHFTFNPASGRVLEKIGMRREGLLREHFFKPGRGFVDAVLYGLLLAEWNTAAASGFSPTASTV